MGASWVPIKPPANTTIEDTAIINDWAMVNNQTLRGREVKVGVGYKVDVSSFVGISWFKNHPYQVMHLTGIAQMTINKSIIPKINPVNEIHLGITYISGSLFC